MITHELTNEEWDESRNREKDPDKNGGSEKSFLKTAAHEARAGSTIRAEARPQGGLRALQEHQSDQENA